MNSYDLQSINILIIEPNQFMRAIIRRIITTFGVRTISDCSNIETALEMFKAAPADLVFSDWSPKLNGLELLEKLRNKETSPNPFVPVVLVTANSEMHHVITARDRGMTEFLVKPISARQIYGRVCSVIEHQRPFAEGPEFFGPCRRRRPLEFVGQERRAE